MGSLQKVSGGRHGPPGPRVATFSSWPAPEAGRVEGFRASASLDAGGCAGDVRWSRRVAPADSGQGLSSERVALTQDSTESGRRGDVMMACALTEHLGRVEA